MEEKNEQKSGGMLPVLICLIHIVITLIFISVIENFGWGILICVPYLILVLGLSKKNKYITLAALILNFFCWIFYIEPSLALGLYHICYSSLLLACFFTVGKKGMTIALYACVIEALLSLVICGAADLRSGNFIFLVFAISSIALTWCFYRYHDTIVWPKKERIPRKPETNPHDKIVSLDKMKELLDAGIITQEEFDAKKKEILGL